MSHQKIVILLWTIFFSTLTLSAQDITGEIVDKDGYAIPYASVSYKGHHVAVSSNALGKFTIPRHEGWTLSVTSVGFKSRQIAITTSTASNLGKIKLQENSRALNEVVVKTKRKRYTRKDNPAVELMRRVIAAKKHTDLERYPYYQYDKYQKITMALNEISEKQLESNFFQKRKYLLDQVEPSPIDNEKLILPIQVDETVSQHVYRKDPRTEKDIIKGQQSSGVGKVLATGEIINTMLKEMFTDVDIYDDHVRLLQYPFPSPIGSTAISFYHFYIEDTVYVDRDKCYHLQFIPANQQDFGFRGELYVLADSSLHVKKCTLWVPKRSGVNWVDNIKIEQEYTKLDNGEWVLSQDDMYAECSITDKLQKMLVVRNTRMNGYAFNPLPKQLYRGKAKVKHDVQAFNRDENFWNQYRSVELTKSESSMDAFIHRMENSKGWKWIITGVKAMVENFVETGKPGKKDYFDFGPINTFISHNTIDGWRFRLGGRTMAALNPHLFLDGWGAYGTKTHNWYYGTHVTYSFNKKKYSSWEFPRREFSFESTRDIMSPSDLDLVHSKDNIFMSLKSKSQDGMILFNRQGLSFMYETEGGMRYKLGGTTQSNVTLGDLHLIKVNDGQELFKYRTTDLTGSITWNPGTTYINTKQHRWPVNLDSPEISVSHTTSFKGVLGGDYRSNVTTVNIYKRQWLGSWGFMAFHIDAKAQWNKVPYPLLNTAPTNLTFVESENTFSLLKDWEFLNDRQVFWSWYWDMNGKLFNRIPLIKKLKWREFFSVKGMWGHLTDKNNPYKNPTDPDLFRFPEATTVMSNQPYWEVEAGVHNIFRFLSIGYVRRITYRHAKEADNWGIRFNFLVSF